MVRQEILAAVKKMVTWHLLDTDAKVYLFGSWVRGEENQGSDIDIGIWYDNPLPSGTLSCLREALEESTIPYAVDLVDLTQTNSDFRQAVLEEAELWKD